MRASRKEAGRLTSYLLRFGLLVVFVLGSNTAVLAGLPDLKIPSSIGVNIHRLVDANRELDSIHEAGFRIVRIDLTWEAIEASINTYDFSHYDELLQRVRDHGLRPLLILGYSNKLYEPTVLPIDAKATTQPKAAGPTREKTVDAFARFVSAAVLRYKGLDPIWEIWNEPDLPGSWPPSPVARQYVRLATRACQSIRTSDPLATVIAPGASQKPTRLEPTPPFLVQVLSSALANCLDGLSLHPYLHLQDIDATVQLWARTKELIRSSIPPGDKDLAMVSSEWGLSTFGGKISDQSQATYLVRMLLLNLASGVRASIVYDWRDDGSDPIEPEHHFGVTYYNLEKKPAWYAVRELTRRLEGFSVVCARTAGPMFVVLENSTTNEHYVAVWEASTSILPFGRIGSSLKLPRDFKVSGAWDAFGDLVEVESTEGQFILKGTIQPYYARIEATPALCKK